jgi:cytochrome c553
LQTRLLLTGCLLFCQWPVYAATDAKTLADTVCAACHGVDGNSIADTFPKLAGQVPEYLLKQMTDFLGAKRKNDVMTPFLPALKSANLQELAEYFSALAPSTATGKASASSATGEQLYNNGNIANGVPGCVGCHGPGGRGVDMNARLAGQYQSYLIAQINAFKSGARNNDKARVMRNAVVNLSEAEISAVTEYLVAQ